MSVFAFAVMAKKINVKEDVMELFGLNHMFKSFLNILWIDFYTQHKITIRKYQITQIKRQEKDLDSIFLKKTY